MWYSFDGVNPIPIFPWGYVGGVPHGYTADKCASMGELQTAILQRLGPLGPKEWERNTRFRQPSSLFTIEDILGNRQSVFKSVFEYKKGAPGTPRATSIPREHGSSPAPPSDNNKAPDQQKKHELSGYPSPPSILRNAAKLSQSLPAEKSRSSTSVNGENRNPDQGDQKTSTSSQDSRLSHLKEGFDEHDNQVPVPNERLGRNPSPPASTERRSTLSVSLERFVNMSARLHCVEDENFDNDTIAWLVMGLGGDESRERLFYFYDHATVDIWYCLGDVLSQPVRRLTELGSSQEACISHGLSCKRVMVIQDESGSRRRRFESVHRDE
ncbi:hypothetical protein FDENT_1369 [Fusarium denticulatum]|uniref:Uncharacterized protein n=1 Tax=Fusarium denticulatum TaxID=48507 RepID=A0A8H6CVY9_9HYPO|nr:hypothetical protein FDENT_1369 [Fusarium denticulatum]